MQELTIARIGRPHGVQGWVHVHNHNPDSSLLESLPALTIQWPDGPRREFAVEQRKGGGDGWLFKLTGIDDRESAQVLTNALVYVSAALLDELEPDEFYYSEVIGYRVIDSAGAIVGTVRDVTYTNIDVLIVDTPDGEYMIPVLDDFVERIDSAAQRVVIDSLQDEMKSDG